MQGTFEGVVALVMQACCGVAVGHFRCMRLLLQHGTFVAAQSLKGGTKSLVGSIPIQAHVA